MDTLKRRHRHYLDKNLLFRLRIFFFISIILLGVVGFEILTGRVSPLIALISLGIGLIGGVFTARMFLLSWDKNAKRVIARLDIVGGVILVLYILFALFRGKIIGHFISANYVTGASLSVVAGVMIGRVFGTGRKIISILKEENLFHS